MHSKKINTAKNKILNYWNYSRGNTPMVLLYHRVETPGNDPQLLAVTPDNFYEQVNFLKKEYSLLTTEEFGYHLSHHKALPSKTILLSFDDGYADNLLKALPVLEALTTEAIFFITTSLVSTRKELWWDELERIFLTTAELPANLELNTHQNERRFLTGSSQQCKETYDQLHPIVKYLPLEERNRVLDQLRTWAGITDTGRATHRLMTWDEVKQMAQSKYAVIGAHTVNHVPLSILNFQDQLTEIRQSKDQLESVIKRPVNYFSYPYGSRRDFNLQSVDITRQCGFFLAFANYPGYVHRLTDHFKIPRILVRNWNAQELGINLAKFHG